MDKIIDGLKHYLFSWRALFTYSLFIFIISVIPIEASLGLSFSDKIFHFLIYGILSVTATNVFLLKKKRHPHFLSLAYAFLFGLFIELVQSFLPYRSFELVDIAANFLGGILGCLIKIV